MSVEIIEPSQALTVSDAAARHFRERIRVGEGASIRLRVKPSGCTGYMYELQMVEAGSDGDLAIALGDDLYLYVDQGSLPMLHGTHIDYVREGLNSLLRFENPNAGDYCGCGESFSFEQDGAA